MSSPPAHGADRWGNPERVKWEGFSRRHRVTPPRLPQGPAARRKAAERLRGPEVEIAVSLGAGRGSAELWTCDLSYDYVKINAEYTT